MASKGATLKPLATLFKWSRLVGFPLLVKSEQNGTKLAALTKVKSFNRKTDGSVSLVRAPHAFKTLIGFILIILFLSTLILDGIGWIIGLDLVGSLEFMFKNGMTILDIIFGQGVFLPPTFATIIRCLLLD